jgi:hypothetical protein
MFLAEVPLPRTRREGKEPILVKRHGGPISIGHGQETTVGILLHPFPFQETLLWPRKVGIEIHASRTMYAWTWDAQCNRYYGFGIYSSTTMLGSQVQSGDPMYS